MSRRRALLGEVDDVFARLEHHLLPVAADLDDAVLMRAQVAQPAAAVRERPSARVAVERLDVVVLHAVRPGRRQVQEPPVAAVAAVARVALVDGGHVPAHRRDVAEGPGALRALVRPLPGVNGHVLL